MKYTYFWRDGKRDVFEGNTPEDAFDKAGFSQGAVRSLDFYSIGDDNRWKWNSEEHEWNLIDPSH